MDVQSKKDTDEPLRSPPPAPRMTEGEAQAVIRLWQQEQADNNGLTNRPSLADIAEGLGIAPEEARRLLAQVRRPQLGMDNLPHGPQAVADAQQARIDREHRRLARRVAWGTAAAALAAGLLHFLH